jgi:N-acyl-D-aspartate/D-glutamate deacylase
VVDNLERRGGPERIQFPRFPQDTRIEGRTLAQVAEERGHDPVDEALSLIERGGPSIISFNMHEDDVKRPMAQPWTMTSSDGALTPFGEGVPHPRNYGTFTRKIQRYVVEQNVIDLAFAVRTNQAARAGLSRGTEAC